MVGNTQNPKSQGLPFKWSHGSVQVHEVFNLYEISRKAEPSGQFCQKRLMITTNEWLLRTHIKTAILDPINFATTIPQNYVILLHIPFSKGVWGGVVVKALRY
jgi:hypothetical protein